MGIPETLPSKQKASLESFLRDLKQILGERLKSVILYGSAARGEWHPERSDVNLLVVLDRVDGATLRRTSKVVRGWWRKAGLAALFLSDEELRASSDVFPLEYLEMKRHHVVLHGGDLLADLKIGARRLRLQVEHELRGKILRLRQAYLRDAGSPRACADLMANSWPSVATVLRGVLLARGMEGESSPPVLARQLEEVLSIPSETLLGVAGLRTARKASGREETERLFDGYLAALEKVLAALEA